MSRTAASARVSRLYVLMTMLEWNNNSKGINDQISKKKSTYVANELKNNSFALEIWNILFKKIGFHEVPT